MTEVTQSSVYGSDSIDHFLAHYGVKGMRWGVRRSEGGGQSSRAARRAARRAPQEAKAVVVPGKGVKVSGGKNLAPTADAIEARKARAIASRSGLDALSNAQLKKLNERMNMEQQYSKLAAGGKKEVSLGKQMVDELLKDNGKLLRSAVPFVANFFGGPGAGAAAAAGSAVATAAYQRRKNRTTATQVVPGRLAIGN